ncbi:MAG: efflux RND transporter periplasmic adaptor subunit [Cyanobacteria bacterium CRU_2_1]|nr:efflux RND transporter periplasmic adaptor subunit [Cyanobacteria bacterium RU_5_0]NJR61629.1 efflux RND transporter periplasmic adaptor subunit [Cyanobacteria bacterium CRU_2_1]
MTIDKLYPNAHAFLGKKLSPSGITQWFVRLVMLALLLGGGWIAYRQFIVAPTHNADRLLQSVPVERKSLPITVSANGAVEPERSINVSPRNAGFVKELLVDVGDSVEEGQIIAYMDDANLQGQLTQAQGQLAAAEANLEKLLSGNRSEDIAQAEAQLEEARSTLQQAELTFQQDQELYKDGAISQRELESSRASRDGAQAQVTRLEQALKLQQRGARSEDIVQAQADVLTAQGSLQSAQEQLDDTVIRAPFSGVVTRKYADPGAFVTPTTAASSENSATSSSILSLASTNQVVANVAETNIARMELGQSAIIRADAYPGQTFEGQVVEISPESTVEQNVTSFEVKVSINDPEKLLRSGMNVDTEFEVGQLDNALVVPTVAIVRQEMGTGVFIASDDGKPVFTLIETGANIDNYTEVRSGLTGDERVLISLPDSDRSPSSVPGGVPMLVPAR